MYVFYCAMYLAIIVSAISVLCAVNAKFLTPPNAYADDEASLVRGERTMRVKRKPYARVKTDQERRLCVYAMQ
jgi:hypothetical protein